MTGLSLPQVEAAVARLPERYEPLLLTFHRAPLKVVHGVVVIGTDEGTEFQVDLSDGRVSSVDPAGDLPSRFVSSSVSQLADAIAVYREYAAGVQGARDEEARRLVEELRRRLSEVDAAATRDPEAWWSVILEQTEDGLL